MQTISISIEALKPSDQEVIVILPKDSKAQNRVFEAIRKNLLTNIDDILAEVDKHDFSSTKVLNHTKAGFEALFKVGALDPEELKRQEENTIHWELNDDGSIKQG